jgi:hypothetical protein
VVVHCARGRDERSGPAPLIFSTCTVRPA